MSKIFPVLFIIALMFLSFFSGAFLTYYQYFPYSFIYQINTGATAWQEIRHTEADFVEDEQAPTSARKVAEHFHWKVKKHDKEKSWGDFTFICPTDYARAQLMDMSGNVIHEWAAKYNNKPIDGQRFDYAYLMTNGDVLAIDFHNRNKKKQRLVKFDKDSNILWEKLLPVHHMIKVGEDNLIYVLIDPDDYEKPANAPYFNTPFLHDYVLVLDQNGHEVKRVSIVNAFLNSSFKPMMKDLNFRNAKGDFLHNNTISILSTKDSSAFPQFKAGDILLSARNPGIVAVLDMEKEEITWAKTGIWHRQHSPDFMPNGHFIVFDNHGIKGSRKSRLLEIDPVSGDVVEIYGLNKNLHFFADLKADVDLLPNGNFLVFAEKKILEFTPKGNIVWQANNKSNARLECGRRFSKEELTFLNP